MEAVMQADLLHNSIPVPEQNDTTTAVELRREEPVAEEKNESNEPVESVAKKPRLETEEEKMDQVVQSLKKTSDYVVIERNYTGSPKDGSVKGEVEWGIWDSDLMPKDEKGSFIYDYSEHHEEHALILEGSGKLVPKNVTDNSDSIAVNKGDYIIFKRGFLCEWHIQERIRKRYCFFDEKGEVVVAGEKIACDICGKDCTDESVAVHKGEDEENVEDLCLPCYRLNSSNYSTQGEHLVNGVTIGDLESINAGEKRKREDGF